MTTMTEQIVSVSDASEQAMPLAFEDLFEAEHARLFRALLLVTHDSGEAEDLMQDAFVRVWERWDRVATVDDPVGYLFRTAGTELFFDTRWWNQQPVTLGIRYCRLLDREFSGPTNRNVWEIILPVNLF